MKALGISNEKIETEIENEKGLFSKIMIVCHDSIFLPVNVL